MYFYIIIKKMTEKKLSRSNNWKTFKSKTKNFGYSIALISALGLTWCDSNTLEVKKAAEEYQEAIENVQEAKENLKEKQEALKDAQKKVFEAQKDLIEAQKKEAEAKNNVKKESNRL